MARRKGRRVDGVLLLHKPAGMTSNHALQRAKRLFFVEKAGHTGALDPLATGVLPLCFGEATKFSQFLLDADKGYRTCIRLGATTDTCDADGEILEQKSTAGITLAQVEAALKPLTGDILQVPPMYSALKLNGQPLYKMARQGVEVELDIRCTKGTYIRSIAVDLGVALGCGGHVKTLHRSAAGLFDESQCITLEELQAHFDERQAAEGDEAGYAALDAYLLSTDAPVASLPAVDLSANSAHYFRLGNPVMVSKVYRFGEQGDIVRVFCTATEESPRAFLGLGSITDEGGVAPKRILANRSANES